MPHSNIHRGKRKIHRFRFRSSTGTIPSQYKFYNIINVGSLYLNRIIGSDLQLWYGSDNFLYTVSFDKSATVGETNVTYNKHEVLTTTPFTNKKIIVLNGGRNYLDVKRQDNGTYELLDQWGNVVRPPSKKAFEDLIQQEQEEHQQTEEAPVHRMAMWGEGGGRS